MGAFLWRGRQKRSQRSRLGRRLSFKPVLEVFLHDLRYAARGLRKSPTFTMVALVTLGLGIGANTAVFTVVDAALLRGLPYRDTDRLVHVWEATSREPHRQLSYPDFADVRDRSRSFESVAGYANDGFTLTTTEGSEQIDGARVSAGFFRTLGVAPILGRSFRPEEDKPLRQRDVVLLTHGLWRRRFAGDPTIVGKQLTLSGGTFTVIGVLPAPFHFARLGDPEIYATLSPTANAVERRYMHWMWGLARLRPGVGIEQANADLTGIARGREREDPRWHKDTGLFVAPLRDSIFGTIRPLLLGLLAAVAGVLLIACVNVANMLLARASGRRQEVGVRVALGASRRRLVAQFLTESLLLGLLGGAAGLLWAGWGVRAMVAAIPDVQLRSLPFLMNLSLHPGVLLFTITVCVATSVLFGLVPALHASGGSVSERLKEGGRGGSGKQRLRGLFVVTEVALALMLSAAAGLLTRSLYRLLNVDPGFSTQNLLTARLTLPSTQYDTPEKVETFYRSWKTRIESLPGVKSVAMVDRPPLMGAGNSGTPTIVGRPAPDSHAPETQMRTVSLDYFRVMGIPLLAGRDFTEVDRAGARRTVIVNQAFVEQVLGGDEAIGRQMSFAFLNGQVLEIVGVVGNENVADLDARVRAALYYPWLQDRSPSMSVLVRTPSDPATFARVLRTESLALEPNLVVSGARSMQELINGAPPTFLRRYPLLLFGSFAAVALVLAAIGIYGVMSYSVSQRTGEIGIRMALGARPGDVLALVLKQGLGLALLGVVVGLGGGLIAARGLATLLFDTRPTDPGVFGSTAVVLTAVAAVACWFPARRASRVNPLTAVRFE